MHVHNGQNIQKIPTKVEIFKISLQIRIVYVPNKTVYRGKFTKIRVACIHGYSGLKSIHVNERFPSCLSYLLKSGRICYHPIISSSSPGLIRRTITMKLFLVLCHLALSFDLDFVRQEELE